MLSSTKMREEEQLNAAELERTGRFSGRRSFYTDYEVPDFTFASQGNVRTEEPEIEVTRNRVGTIPDYTYTEEYPTYEEKDYRRESSDLLPSQTTLNTLNRPAARTFEKFEQETKVNAKVTAKGKLIIAIYAVAVTALFLIVVFNAIAISALTAESGALESRVASQTQLVDQLKNELNHASDSAVLAGKAEDMGMSQGSAGTINAVLPPAVQKDEIQTQTNWFDWLCDIFSGAFGG